MRFNQSSTGTLMNGVSARWSCVAYMGSLLFAVMLMLASQNSMAQTFDINCTNLDNNPSASDCLLDTGSGAVPIQDSQLANLTSDFDEINTCSGGITNGTTGTCNSARFTCSITKDVGGSVTNANCALLTVPDTVFKIDCSSISASDAVCTVTNDVASLRSSLLAPSSPIGSLLTPSQISFADTMLTVCNNQYGITTALQSDCLILETLLSANDPQAATLIDAITPDAASAAVDATQTSLRGINRNIAQRMSSIRRAARLARMASHQGGAPAGGGSQEKKKDKDDDSDSEDKKDDSDEENQSFLSTPPSTWLADNASDWRTHYQALSGGGASADMSYGQLGVFVNAMGDNGDRDSTGNERGFSFSGGELTTGVDYRFGETGFLGMAFGFTHSKTDVKDGRGKLGARSYNLVLYGSVNPTPESFIDVNMIVGGGQFEQDRNIVFNDTDPTPPDYSINQVASASYFSKQSSLNLTLGYDLANGALSVSPYVGVNIMNSSADAYDESISDPNANGGGLALHIDEQSFDSKTMTFGTQLAYVTNHAWGVLMPQATLEWINETKGNAEVVKGHFVGDPNQGQFRLPTDAVDSVYYSLGLGCSAIFPGGNTLYGMYQKFIGYEGFSYSSVNLGMRWEL